MSSSGRTCPDISRLPEPAAANGFLEEHARLLRWSFWHWTGRDLVSARGLPVDGGKQDDPGRWLYYAPFALVSHDTGADPVFNYGNRKALELFEMSWDEFTALPSRLSAEPMGRAERSSLLQTVSSRGIIEHYAGVRIARSGRRFRIDNAAVWNVVNQAGEHCGQAAMFAHWTPLPSELAVPPDGIAS